MDNKIYNFFKNKFSGPIVEENWNRPPDDVWGSILEGLEEPSTKRNYWLLFPWIIAGVSLLLFFVTLHSYNKIGERVYVLEEEVIKLNDAIEDQSEFNRNAQLESGETKNMIASLTTTSMNTEVDDSSKETIGSSMERENTQERLNVNKELHLARTSSGSSGNEDDRVGQKEEFSEALALQNQLQEFRASDDLPRRSSLDIGLLGKLRRTPLLGEGEDSEYLKLPTSFSISEIAVPKSDTKYLGVAVRYNSWIDQNIGGFSNPLGELLMNENTVSSIAFGLHASSRISKRFTANIALFYTQKNHESSYLLSLPFVKGTETIDLDGEYINAFQHSLPTSLGDVQTDVVLSRSASAILADNELVDIDLSFDNHSSSLVVPISISYFVDSAYNGVFMNAGIVNEMILTSEINNVESLSHHTSVMDKLVLVDYNSSQQNKFNISTTVGIGYAKEVGQSLRLVASSNYDFALSTSYRTSTYEHKLDNLSFGLSLIKSFD